MTLYADSSYNIGTELATIHAAQFDQLSKAGTWGTGLQRRSVASEARQASYKAGVLEKPEGNDEEIDLVLPEHVRNVIHRLSVAPAKLDHEFYQQALKDGLTDVEYVEIVGIVARITNLDIFARGLGIPLRSLPQARSGIPTCDRPSAAITELAWVPTIPNGKKGGEYAIALYGSQPKPYIIRALSLVPEELRAHLELEEVQYLPLKKIMNYDHQTHEGLNRVQVEVVAARVSAINECFY